jgi:ubiquinone/menaquinone biosynthesis C-methylase UbiE
MAATAQQAFDRLADRYDEIWSLASAGVHQRHAVWMSVRPLFQTGEIILDIGCGTGVDALFMMATGVGVEAIDASAEMVRVARAKGVAASCLTVESLSQLTGTYDGALANFGVLNCVADLEAVAASLARLIRPGGPVALCVMGAFCLWETCHFIRTAEFRKAIRRWRRGPSATSLGIDVWYPAVQTIERAFRPFFRLAKWQGIGIGVPPSYIKGLSHRTVNQLAAIDAAVSSWPLLRALSDHRLLVFVRL